MKTWLSVQLGLLENLTLQNPNSCSIPVHTTQSSIYSFWKVSGELVLEGPAGSPVAWTNERACPRAGFIYAEVY